MHERLFYLLCVEKLAPDPIKSSHRANASGSTGFFLVGATGGTPMSSMSPLITAVSPPPIFVDHDKKFFRYFFNHCMTKANLASITS